ncbi:hypothetical protein G6F22_022123 [Rhizopus arrhizus]|nr:hypothetical protein G6F22_022123 [Rhizopus arrhizus]KAG0771442.1 hypothetical protein G6F21_014744 [Rhizopus arrhizus]
MQADQFAVDLAAQSHLRQRRNGAQRVQIALQRAHAGGGYADSHGNLPVFGRAGGGGALTPHQPVRNRDQHGQQ